MDISGEKLVMSRKGRNRGKNRTGKNQSITYSRLRTQQYSEAEIARRVPEVGFLRDKTTLIVGLGSLGAPIAIELARLGIGRLILIDHDVVDPSASVRWPLGAKYAGWFKVEAIRDFIQHHYPYSTPDTKDLYRIQIGLHALEKDSFDAHLNRIQQADIIIDATAEDGVNVFLSDMCREAGKPYIWCWTTNGTWGGIVGRQLLDDNSPCYYCLNTYYNESENMQPAQDPSELIQAPGCGDPTFTGLGFESAHITLSAIRFAVSTLSGGQDDQFPIISDNFVCINLRDKNTRQLISPQTEYFNLEPHDQCPYCQNKNSLDKPGST